MSAGRNAFHELRVARIVQETADARSFVLDVPSLAARTLRATRPASSSPSRFRGAEHTLNRCYSLSSAPACDDALQFTVKRVAAGRVSNWFHDEIREGDSVRALPPTGGFTLRAGSQRPLALFGGGSGITPVISIVKTALATTGRSIMLVYANRDADSIIFRDALDALAVRHADRLTVIHHLDAERGFLDESRVRSEIGSRTAEAEFYLCGPGPFMELIERVLRERGVPDDRIFIERFEHPDQPATRRRRGNLRSSKRTSGALAPAATLTVHLDGATHEIPCTAGETLLQAARKAGLSPPSACEDGYCGCCMATLVRGEVEMAACHALDDDDRARRQILTCQARPVSGAIEVRWD